MTEEPIEAVIARLKLLAGEDSCGISVENKARLARLLEYVEVKRMDALEAALTDCHEFFGQLYAHGVRLPHAGEQQLERVASRVAKLMKSNKKL